MLPDSTALDKDLQTCLIRVRVREIVNTNPEDWHKLINAGYDFRISNDSPGRYSDGEHAKSLDRFLSLLGATLINGLAVQRLTFCQNS